VTVQHTVGASSTSSPDLEAALGIKTVGKEGENERRVEREEREGKREEERGSLTSLQTAVDPFGKGICRWTSPAVAMFG